MTPPESGNFLQGIPISVDPALIDRALSRLWKPSEPREHALENDQAGTPSVTRACLSNLILYLPDTIARIRAFGLVPLVGRRFPSRMFLLTHGKEREGGEAPLSAWITAVCHLTFPGAPPICCEQIALEAAGGGERSLELFRGAVMSLLLPDVPVILCLLSPEGESLAAHLEPLVDRVILDSTNVPLSRLEFLRSLLHRERLTCDDLAWRRTASWRRILCDIFDEALARPILDGLRAIRVEFAGDRAALGSGTSGAAQAALVAGWLASRLGWKPAPATAAGEASRPEVAGAFDRDGQRLRVLLSPREGDAPPGEILKVHLAAAESPEGAYLSIEASEDLQSFQVNYSTEAACVLPRTILRQSETEADLLGEALERVTHQGVLRGAVDLAASLGD